MIWNIGLTCRTSTVTIVTLDMASVIRVAAQQLSEVSEGEGLEIAKDKLAHRLRATVQAFALKHIRPLWWIQGQSSREQHGILQRVLSRRSHNEAYSSETMDMDWVFLRYVNPHLTVCDCPMESFTQFAGAHVYWDNLDFYTQTL